MRLGIKGTESSHSSAWQKNSEFHIDALCLSSSRASWSLRSGLFDSGVFSDFSQKLPDGATPLLVNARTPHARRSLTDQGCPTFKEPADSKPAAFKYALPYAPHLDPIEFTGTFNS